MPCTNKKQTWQACCRLVLMHVPPGKLRQGERGRTGNWTPAGEQLCEALTSKHLPCCKHDGQSRFTRRTMPPTTTTTKETGRLA
eukprot:363607-Chlamydomonas_euryale.AAC.12